MIRNDRRTRTVALTAALLVILASGGASLVAATAAPVEVELDPSEATVEAGEPKTFEIVATGVEDGVGAGEIAAHVSDVEVATITDVELRGDPELSDVRTNADNSTVEMLYVMADTNETGTVTIAEVTVLGKSNGTVEVSAGDIERNEGIRLFDETGKSHGAIDASPAEISVESPDDRDTGAASGSDSSAPDVGTGSSDLGSDGSSTDGRDGGSRGDGGGNGGDETSDNEGDGSDANATNNTSGESESGAEEGPSPTHTNGGEADDETPFGDAEVVDQVGFGVVPAIIAILVATRLANRRGR